MQEVEELSENSLTSHQSVVERGYRANSEEFRSSPSVFQDQNNLPAKKPSPVRAAKVIIRSCDNENLSKLGLNASGMDNKGLAISNFPLVATKTKSEKNC